MIERIREHTGLISDPAAEPGLTDSGYLSLMTNVVYRERVLARVRARVGDYLSQVERQVMLGQPHAQMWERNRVFVDEQLRRVAPQAQEQLVAAEHRRMEGEPEDLAQALTSCPAVKTLADVLYPATGEDAEGVDGVNRKMSDDKFISRLVQFVTERARESLSRDLLVSQVQDMGRRLEAVNALASKGVHSNVSQAEVDQCLVQMYLTVGDLLRIEAGTSAALGPIPEG